MHRSFTIKKITKSISKKLTNRVRLRLFPFKRVNIKLTAPQSKMVGTVHD